MKIAFEAWRNAQKSQKSQSCVSASKSCRIKEFQFHANSFLPIKKFSSSSAPNNSVLLSKMIQKRKQKKTAVARYIGFDSRIRTAYKISKNIHACNGTLPTFGWP